MNTGKLNIIVAVYGLKIVTNHVRNLIIDGIPQTLSFVANNRMIGEDGWRGQQKSITILYDYDGGSLQVITAKEGEEIIVNPEKIRNVRPTFANITNSNGMSILAASYGPDDVTYKVQRLVSSHNVLSFKVDNTMFGDTWYGVAKTLVVILGSGNEVSAAEIFTEREMCYVDLNDVIPVL